MVAAWLFAFGLLAVGEIFVLLAYAGSVRWSAPASWVYLGLMASILLGSGYTLARLGASGRSAVSS